LGIHAADWEDVHGEDGGGGVVGEGAGADLGPSAGGGAEVDDGFGILEDVEFAVDLGEFEGCSGSKALFFGQSIIFILIMELFPLGVFHHDCFASIVLLCN